MDMLLTELSVYKNSYDTNGVDVSLEAVVERIRDGKKGLDEKTRMCNVLAQTDPDAYKKYKESELPAVTFAGTFPRKKRLAAHLAKHSGCVVLDIDGLLPSQIPELLVVFAQHPNVLLAFISPSGRGIKLVVRVTPKPTNDAEHKTAWYACVAFFENLADEYRFEIDPSGKDVNRLCFLAHDPMAIVHTEATPIQWDPKDVCLHTSALSDYQHTDADTSSLHAFLKSQEVQIIGTRPRGGFFVECLNRSEHTRGKQGQTDSFIRLSESGLINHCSHSHCKDKNSLWFFEQLGIKTDPFRLPPRTHRKPKLHRAELAPGTPTETLQQNRDLRAEATDTFLTDTSNDTLHFLLIKDPTGTGKTQTILTQAKQHGKRTLAQLPHSDLARQAVDTALELGFKDPFHLLGREHNWDDSGIADIPVSERTPALFEKNNCIMVDVLKKYTDKRLAPRTFCETKCPFRDGCPHLAQYEGLGQRDFVASCTPNLLFDLNFRSYLQTIVTATHAPTDEALAIDAMLGTQSEIQNDFDLAILDDYGINGLYTDITFSASEFKALKIAWEDTPTGDFAKGMLKSFKKKKPEKIVKALRKAFESTAEHHKDIATDLTQHARIGTIEYAEHPKHSKETQRLLAEKVVQYDDGGRQFIPVDFDAYQELREKDIPTVHPKHLQTQSVGDTVRVPHTPTHALIAGVKVEALTPIWQKGATPIELIRIFLDSIGNDKNAPITKAYRAGENPKPVLTFSIPPQAPVGILPHIAMLSATTDISDTQRAFDGQDVTFSEHTGGQLQSADGVQVYQYQDARLTSASVFEYAKDTEGKRKLQQAPIGVTKTAEKRLQKLNDWAKATDGRTAFISYKEFTQQFRDTVDGFDIVTHFDKVAGMNFDGLKYLVVFGYPKVKHTVIIEHTRKQYASDTEPLPKGTYEELTETAEYDEDGITVTERRYKDPRLEKIRHQLSTEKLQQAIGRARLPLWTDTTTLIFTNAPVAGITERATLFSSADFNLADAPNDLPDAMQRIQQAEDSGDVKAVMETKGVKKSKAYNDTQGARKQNDADRDARILELHLEGKSQRDIEKQMKAEGYQKAGKTTIQKVVTNSTSQLVYTNYKMEKVTTPSDVGVPCVDSETVENRTDARKTVPLSEYPKLSEDDARAELKKCESSFNYNGAALLRTLSENIASDRPDILAVEKCFHNKNIKSSMTTGAVIGVVQLMGAQIGCAVSEFTPQQVKMASGLGGSADKKAVQRMMCRLFQKRQLNNHSADAAACAIAGIQNFVE